MRLGASSPTISIDPGEAVNWLWYCSPAYLDEDYEPAPRARPAGEALAASQWRAWQEQLWRRTQRDPSRVRLDAVPSWGDDPPRFASLSRWPELQTHCQAAWPQFSEWFDAARDTLIPLTMAAHVRRSCQAAVQVMGHEQRVRVEVVALVAERALIEEPDRAVIAAGLLRADDRFGRWLTQFVARNTS
jgi:hypothetical protein